VNRPPPDVAIVDSGGANIASLKFALTRLGVAGKLTVDPATIRSASHVIMPGVGAARSAMERLQETGLERLIPQLKQPVLGICLGLQLMFEKSEEDNTDCLGILPGSVLRFSPAPGRPVPHMGWNQVRKVRNSALMADVPDNSYFYFVHSYAAETGEMTVGCTEYGWPFAAVVASGNFLATQFHPERSGPLGAQVLRNFLERY